MADKNLWDDLVLDSAPDGTDRIAKMDGSASDFDSVAINNVGEAKFAVSAAGSLVCADGAESLVELAIGSAGQLLKVNAGGTAPEWGNPPVSATVVLVDNTTDNAVGDGAGDITLTIPESLNGYVLSDAQASVEVAGTTGTQDIQIYNITDSVDMLTTKITIDSGELTSYTAATASSVNTSNDDVATGDKLRFDVDAVHTTAAKGLQVILTFTEA